MHESETEIEKITSSKSTEHVVWKFANLELMFNQTTFTPIYAYKYTDIHI